MVPVAVWLMAASTAVAAVGTIAAARNQAKAAKFNKKVAKQNSTIARQNAAENEERHRRLSRKRLGTMRATFAGRGLLNGSALDVLADSAAQEELDALTIRHEGELKARGYSNTAELEGARAKSVMVQGYTTAASDVLSGAGQAISMSN